MHYFIDYSFFGLARSYLSKLADGERKQHIEALVLMGELKYD